MFEAMHKVAQHTISLPLPIEDCFALFTPEGEKGWVADWRPAYFYPSDGHTVEKMVFTTDHGGETTVWSLLDLDQKAGYLRYIRITPGSRFTTVEVRLGKTGQSQTDVTVRYTFTGLSPEGNASIEAATGPAFAAMIEGWRTLILKSMPS